MGGVMKFLFAHGAIDTPTMPIAPPAPACGRRYCIWQAQPFDRHPGRAPSGARAGTQGPLRCPLRWPGYLGPGSARLREPSGMTLEMRPAADELSRDRAPFVGEALGAAQREGEDRVGRIRRASRGKDARPGDVEIGNLVALAVAVDDRVRRLRTHDGAAHQVDRRHVAPARPVFLRACGLGNLSALL